ncbi:MAG: PAS domain S-box protein [Candidatus Delongbacteria bacterium]|jgi:PAS domain S-box-containing protein|nr:PAS domain S-box protein [Candidatus Delongbacteria bacterium]
MADKGRDKYIKQHNDHNIPDISNDMVYSILNSVDDAVMAIDITGGMLYMNYMVEAMAGCEFQKVKGKSPGEIFSAHNTVSGAKPGNTTDEVFKTGQSVRSEEPTIIDAKDGNKCYLEEAGSPVFDQHNKVIAIVLVFRDVTEKHIAKEALQKSEEKYRTVFENTGTATVIVENDGIIFLANDCFAILSGYSKEEIENKMKWMDFVDERDLKRMWEQHELRRKNREAALTKYEFRFIDRLGNTKHISLSIDVIPGTDKSVASLLDISPHKQIEEQLRSDRDKFSMIFQESPIGILQYDENAVITECNEKFVEVIGSSREVLIGLNMIKDLKDNKLIQQVKKSLEKGSGYYKGNYTSVTRGKTTPVRIVFKGIKNAEGKYYAGIGLVEDITERIKAEKNLQEQKRQLSAMIKNLPGFIYRCKYDPDWTMLYISQGFKAITGYDPEELIDNHKRAYNDIIISEYQTVVKDDWSEAIDQKSTHKGEYQIKTAENKIKWVWERGTGIYDEKGNLLFLEGYIEEITQRKKAEQELYKLKDDLQIKVDEQTRELKKRIEELERFHKATIDREFRIKELRDELNAYKKNRNA